MSGTSVILKKELKRVFGDRKLIFSLFIMPALIVIVLYGLMGFMLKSMIDDVEKHESIVAVVNAPEGFKELASLTGYDQTADITYLTEDEFKAVEDIYRNDILEGNGDLAVIFDADFDAVVANFKNVGDAIPNVKIWRNSSEDYSSEAYSVFNKLMLETYKDQLIANRIGSLEMLNVFNESSENIVKEAKANTQFVSMMLPYLIVLLLFAGAMSVGVDAIAGEKERGTLASMLITPVKRIEIVMGKLLSLCILSGLSAIVHCVSMVVAMGFMGGIMGEVGESGFGNISISVLSALELLAIMLAMVYLFVSLIGTLCIYAKDTKIAGTYISPFYIVVIVAGMMTMFTTGKEVPMSKYLIPVYGNALAIKDICANELTGGNFLACMSGTLLLAIICTVAMVKAFNSEKVMFNA
ncbi:MAG: ABC transporter permease subunit [Lachnospiraceae bacterium]|nr:ABC transporter permease subunit [Lachnospiraceae bacterium]